MINPKAKLLWHGRRVESWLRGEYALPVLVEVAPTNHCNASCPWCDFKGKHGKININKDVMLSTLKELTYTEVKAINWTGGGEPTMHPNFNEFVVEAHRLGIEQGLFTNAYEGIENPEMFKWIRISMTDKGFAAIKKPDGFFGICVNQTVTTLESELAEWCEEAKSMGAKYFQVRPSLAGIWQNQPYMPTPVGLKSIETEDFEVVISHYKYDEAILPHEYTKCYGYHFCPSIDWKGQVGVCLYRMDEDKYVFGNLNEETFTAIWYHKNVSGNLVNDGCQNCCKNHEINKELFVAKHMDHVNFL